MPGLNLKSIGGGGVTLSPASTPTDITVTIPATNGTLVTTESLSASSGAALVGYLPAGTGAVSTTVQSKLRESVSVLDFGADPTGVSDSTAAIQLALNAAGSIYFPVGVYLVSGSLTVYSNTRLHGAGMSVSIIKRKASTPLAYVFGSTAVLTNIAFDGLGIDCNTANNASPDSCGPIYFNDTSTTSSNISIENCAIYNFGDYAMGLQVAGYVGVQTRFNKLYNGGGNIFYHPIYYRRVGKVDVSNNDVSTAGNGACIKVEPLGGGGRVVITSNLTDGGGRGIVMQSLDTDSYLDAVITNNVVKNTTEYGIIHSKDTGGSLAQNNVIVSNNVVSGCVIGVAVFKVNQLLVHGNVVEGCTSNPVYIQDCSLFRVSDNTVRSAAVIDAGGYSGIHIGNGTTTFTGAVTDNVIRCDSATGTRYGVECSEDTYSILDLYDNIYSGSYTATTSVAGPFTTDITYTRSALEVNEPDVLPSVSGSPVTYSAKSTLSNVDLQMLPKGVGSLYASNGYGTHFRAGPGTATVANYITATGGVTGSSPTLTGTGTDGSVGIEVKGKSQGIITLSNGYGTHFRAGPGAATVVNYITATGGVTGLPAVLGGTGTDANVGLSLTTKGTGKFELQLTKVPTFADDTAAGVGGLTSGQLYKTSAGAVMIKL